MSLGWTNAIVVPRDRRGVSSISRTPSARTLQCLDHALDPVPDVVDALAAFLEEPADRRVRTERAELDERRSHLEQHLLDALVVHPLPVGGLEPEGRPVPLDRGLEIGDRDADVIDLRGSHELLRRRVSASGGWSRSISSCACGTWYAGSASARLTAATAWARRSSSGLAPSSGPGCVP